MIHELLVTQSIASQGCFDIILHKWSDFMYPKQPLNEQEKTQIAAVYEELKAYSQCVPHSVLLDPLESVDIFMDRTLIYALLKQCQRDSGGKKIQIMKS
jgi:hypothetical protein